MGFLSFLSFSGRALAIDGIYLGGQLGHVALTGDAKRNFNNAIGFGADVGFRTSGLFDLIFGFQTSSHGGTAAAGGDLRLTSTTLNADFRLIPGGDFDITAGAGPGLYFFSQGGASETKFGINFGAAVDVNVDDALKVGLGPRYHVVFSSGPGSSSYWTIMARVGYLFELM